MKKILKKAALFICAFAIALSSLGVFAADERRELIEDPDDILTAETEEYISNILLSLRENWHVNVYFDALSGSEVEGPKDGEIIKTDSGDIIFKWLDGSNELAFCEGTFGMRADGTKYISKERMGIVEDEIANHSKKVTDKQKRIKDALGIYVGGIYHFNHNEENMPKDMMVGMFSAEKYVKDAFASAEDKKDSLVGAVIGIVIIAAIIVFFARRKTPEGTVPGDGSNFKGGVVGSGTLPVTGIPGSAGYTSGMGGPTSVPK